MIVIRRDAMSLMLSICYANDDDAHVNASQKYTLVLSQSNKKHDANFTISVYCTCPFRFYAAPEMPQHQVVLSGRWTVGTNAGGSPKHPYFYTNPQYRVVVDGQEAVDFHAHAFYPKEISACIMLVGGSHAPGTRMDFVEQEDEILESGPYR